MALNWRFENAWLKNKQIENNLSNKKPNENVVQETNIQTALFFDNDPKKIVEVNSMCKNIIQSIPVKETEPRPIVKFTDIPFLTPGSPQQAHINSLVKKMKSMGYKPPIDDIYDAVSGIQDEHIKIGETWLAATEGKRRAAIFDWDRTLTMIEGFLPIYPESIENMLTYLFGGEERLSKVRDFLTNLDENGVQLIILTNNPSCNHPTQPSYKALFQTLVDNLIGANKFTLICSYHTAAGHKGRAIKQDPRFSKCAASGGRRKTTKKAKKNKKRQTKRRS